MNVFFLSEKAEMLIVTSQLCPDDDSEANNPPGLDL